MSKSTPLSKEETKERIRAALDILGRFTDADGKLNATKMSRRIRELEAGSDVCGDEALHCETARRLRERVRELEEQLKNTEADWRSAEAAVSQEWGRVEEANARIRELEARADKTEAERDGYRDAIKLALTHIRAMTPSTQHPAMVQAVRALKTALKEATDGR